MPNSVALPGIVPDLLNRAAKIDETLFCAPEVNMVESKPNEEPDIEIEEEEPAEKLEVVEQIPEEPEIEEQPKVEETIKKIEEEQIVAKKPPAVVPPKKSKRKSLPKSSIAADIISKAKGSKATKILLKIHGITPNDTNSVSRPQTSIAASTADFKKSMQSLRPATVATPKRTTAEHVRKAMPPKVEKKRVLEKKTVIEKKPVVEKKVIAEKNEAVHFEDSPNTNSRNRTPRTRVTPLHEQREALVEAPRMLALKPSHAPKAEMVAERTVARPLIDLCADTNHTEKFSIRFIYLTCRYSCLIDQVLIVLRSGLVKLAQGQLRYDNQQKVLGGLRALKAVFQIFRDDMEKGSVVEEQSPEMPSSSGESLIEGEEAEKKGIRKDSFSLAAPEPHASGGVFELFVRPLLDTFFASKHREVRREVSFW